MAGFFIALNKQRKGESMGYILFSNGLKDVHSLIAYAVEIEEDASLNLCVIGDNTPIIDVYGYEHIKLFNEENEDDRN